MNTENRWLVNLARNQNSLGGCSMSKLLQNSGTRLPQLMNTSSFHQNVGEGNKSLNAISPDPLLSVAFGKGSGRVRLPLTYVNYTILLASSQGILELHSCPWVGGKKENWACIKLSNAILCLRFLLLPTATGLFCSGWLRKMRE